MAAGPSTEQRRRRGEAMAPTTRSRKARTGDQRRSLGTDPGEPPRNATLAKSSLPGQVVLVLQGGGALGAYQVGVYEALHDAGIEPDWVIGTSIGAINAALIAGNARDERMGRLNRFWRHVESQAMLAGPLDWLGIGNF